MFDQSSFDPSRRALNQLGPKSSVFHISESAAVPSSMAMGSIQRQDWPLIGLTLGSMGILYLLSLGLGLALAPEPGASLPWILALMLNSVGYATILLPGYLLVQYVRRTGYLDSPSLSLLQPLVRLLVRGKSAEENLSEEGAGLLKGESPGKEETASPTSKMTPAQEGLQVTINWRGTYSKNKSCRLFNSR